MQWRHVALGSLTVAAFASTVAWSAGDDHDWNHPDEVHTATPIKHLVVIYGENVSFDHYFGTYPHATNPSGEPAFNAQAGTPEVNGLSGALLTSNPNLNPANGAGASNPFRLDRTQAATADQNHAYTPEQEAYDDGKADLFPKYTGKGTSGGAGAFGTTGQVMGYYDGNTVTALWNYAQRFAMSDNAYTATYGPSTPGALEVVSGQTNGMTVVLPSPAPATPASYYVKDGQGGYTMINDVDPGNDLCSSKTNTSMMTGKNIGDLLNARNITWGGFMGGFNLATKNSNGTTGCLRSTVSPVVGAATADYIPHHNWFQYYASTSNPNHLRPSSIEAIGHTMERHSHTPDPANHEYDVDDFYDAVSAGNFPAVSFLKAPAYQDGHAGYSDPLDEQAFVTKVVNFLQEQKDWKDTAVVVAWDDSDGWYDHAYAQPTSASFDPVADQLNGPGTCGTGSAPNGLSGKPVNGRCGPGTRIPFVVISPWAKENYVDHTQIDQASVVRFIEDNWLDGKRLGGGSFDATAGSIMGMFDFNRRGEGRYEHKLFLDPQTGLVLDKAPKS
ncbi:phospholipase C [Paraburkholderia pallida]|uniref:Phospholipase n=1 Tax=Paraburkholderia pallida TaxID=2547399 RepID=A0A4V1B0N1_9BURK|nr:alkaline phosphatase family protein [Paraburkholderia pallida]QBR03353.1 phospholipase [Paraburkholderia pallida]